jgi:hypothetical protein
MYNNYPNMIPFKYVLLQFYTKSINYKAACLKNALET